eukprot:SAG11_NODE_33584_length_276_cov_0.920904_1_plen_30_part_10
MQTLREMARCVPPLPQVAAPGNVSAKGQLP